MTCAVCERGFITAGRNTVRTDSHDSAKCGMWDTVRPADSQDSTKWDTVRTALSVPLVLSISCGL